MTMGGGMNIPRSIRLMATARARLRRLLAFGVAVVALVGLAGFPPASAATFVDGRLFGMHVPGIANGTVPTVSYGSVRLWDSGVSWGMVEQRRGKYWWAGLDHSIAAANAQNVEIVYVLGSTPRWAATHTWQGTYPNKGAASNPRYITDWRRWVTKVVSRHGASIDAYQIWNEANLQTFWQGTPQQMARLTWEAKKIIRRLDPTAKVVAASSTVRLTRAFNRFFPAYLTELQRYGWPVDVFAIHSYGPSTAQPVLRAKYISLARAALKAAGAPKRPLWDTEVNYGIAGPGLKYPDRDIESWQAYVDVAQTYLDSLRLGVARVYWYAWTPPIDLLGVTMFDESAGALAFQTTRDWVTGATVACSNAPLRVCFVDRAGVPSQIAWRSSGVDLAYVVPAYATRSCDATGACQPVTPGATVIVGRMPTWFGPG
jgi:polysaccharide biosynthesis protein PslG